MCASIQNEFSLLPIIKLVCALKNQAQHYSEQGQGNKKLAGHYRESGNDGMYVVNYGNLNNTHKHPRSLRNER